MVGGPPIHGFSCTPRRRAGETFAAMTLAQIIAFITGRPEKRTSTELRAALAEIDQASLERRVDAIEAQRRQLLLTGTDAELQALLQDLAAANLEAERGTVAAEELKKLIANAEARERAVEVEKTGERAKAQETALVEAYVELDDLAGRIVELLGDVETGRENLRLLNIEVKAANRPDLQGHFPERLLAELLGGANPLSFATPQLWQLHGYYPQQAAVDPERRLGRLRVLLPTTRAARKAAA